MSRFLMCLFSDSLYLYYFMVGIDYEIDRKETATYE